MARAKITIEDITAMKEAYITPVQAADVLGCNSYAINVAARSLETRNLIGFPVIKIGTRCKIPRIPFLRYMGVEVAGDE